MTTDEHLRDLYRQVNGDHPMTPADLDYCRRQFVPLPDASDYPREHVRDLVAAGYLPVPSYLLPSGELLVPRDYLDPIRRAGGHTRVRAWFVSHWPVDERQVADAEWMAYLSGQYVCLRSVTPHTIRAKTRLIERIRALVSRLETDAPDGSGAPSTRRALEACVDELDLLEAPMTAYDRLRFGGPTSREVWIDRVRRDHLAAAAV